jgi:Reverse transcriptase (RNA-dependent DNA polymerase)
MHTGSLKDNIDLFAPFLCQLVCWSLQDGCVPPTLKSTYMAPTLKKAGVNPTNLKSYRPISSLFAVSKPLKRLVAKHLVAYLKDNGSLPHLQSAHLTHRSTDTPVLKVLLDIFTALDYSNLVVFMMLDMSAAFDSVDHSTGLQRLEKSYGVNGVNINWFSSYLDDSSQCVRRSKSTSAIPKLLYNVPSHYK